MDRQNNRWPYTSLIGEKMIDAKTCERVIVLFDEKAGPYIRVSTWNDADGLEGLLSGEYDVLYEMKTPEDFILDVGVLCPSPRN